VMVAVISDIHSNLEALQTVLGEIGARGIGMVVCLGDLVGYNADPDSCVTTVMSRCSQVVRGNHDKAVAGLLDVEWFNPAARAAALWTRSAVSAETLQTVRTLEQGPVRLEQDESVLLCHGTPFDEDVYLMDAVSIADTYAALDAEHPGVRFCFHGHTHVPLIVARRRPNARPQVIRGQEPVELEPGTVYLINPGSVGQPRDGIALASFGILDTGRMVYANVRTQYAVQETQRKIQLAGLPASLAHRLAGGR
jgi:predicted phosphodiesterase